MNLVGFFIFIFIVTNELKSSSATLLVRPPKRSVHEDNFWTAKNSTNHGPSKRSFRRSSGSNDTSLISSDGNSRQNPQRIPQINFYSSIPNALGVIGQGIIWLREISAALGTPIPIWIFTIPFFILGVGLMFMPDLTQLHLPLFYPDGAGDGDPLAAFPPIPDFTKLIPPNFMMEKWG